MLGMENYVAIKPSRSDEVLDAEEQMKIANQVRAHFDSLAPKRSTKPNRSESDSETPVVYTVEEENKSIPELHRFEALKSQSSITFGEERDSLIEEEFVETQYYKELHSVDKQHHTTGSGFIKVGDDGKINGYDLQLENGFGEKNTISCFKSNPATNDWIPNLEDDQVVFVSSKPNRSEGS
ncbi:hypothetical protein RJ641_011398 [Dillenia turbinata]|uniref:Maternal effect embryo arrest 59 n=1 Tax=Dillenia turbinata TaxID=194707 RepID=A0AAN8UYD2_9MAGN